MSINEHPVLVWGGIILASATVIGSVIHAYLYVEDQRHLMHSIRVQGAQVAEDEAVRDANWLKMEEDSLKRQEELLRAVRNDQAAIRASLAAQSSLLRQLNSITTSLDDLNYRLGVHAGQHGRSATP